MQVRRAASAGVEGGAGACSRHARGRGMPCPPPAETQAQAGCKDGPAQIANADLVDYLGEFFGTSFGEQHVHKLGPKNALSLPPSIPPSLLPPWTRPNCKRKFNQFR